VNNSEILIYQLVARSLKTDYSLVDETCKVFLQVQIEGNREINSKSAVRNYRTTAIIDIKNK
jgi:hypothetical protein